MKRTRWVSIAVVALALSGCASGSSDQARYLRHAEGKATQAEIRERLGAPVSTTTAGAGSIWVYQVREMQPGSRMNAPGLWCEEYVLRFDSQTVLREWSRKTHFHGGETQPRFCVPAAMQEPASQSQMTR
jgi:hypothetical protein